MRARLLAVLAAVGITVLGAPLTGAAADDGIAPVEAPRPDVRPDDIARWLEALASDSYAERKEATQKLIAAGPAAVDGVAVAADSDSLELTGRCLSILKRWQQSGDADTQRAAEAALRRLAGSPREDVARSAASALRPTAAWAQQGEPFRRFVARPAGGFAQQALVVPARPVLVRELTVEDDGRKVYLRYENGPNPERSYLVRVTETVEGEERTSESKAESTTELRRKHPDAYALFAKHSRELYRQPPSVLNNAQGAPAGVPLNPPFAAPVPFPAGIPLGGRARIQVRLNDAAGQIDIEAEEDGRQVHITQAPGREVVVRVTETVEGKPRTAEYKARDLEELKKLHPEEAARLYEKYWPAVHGIRVNGIRLPVRIENVPLGAVPANEPAADAERRAEQLRERERRIEQFREQINQRNAQIQGQAEQFRRQADARRVMDLAREQLEARQRNLDQQARRSAELHKHLAEVAASLRKLAEQGEIRPDELRRLAEDLEKLSGLEPAAEPPGAPAAEAESP